MRHSNTLGATVCAVALMLKGGAVGAVAIDDAVLMAQAGRVGARAELLIAAARAMRLSPSVVLTAPAAAAGRDASSVLLDEARLRSRGDAALVRRIAAAAELPSSAVLLLTLSPGGTVTLQPATTAQRVVLHGAGAALTLRGADGAVRCAAAAGRGPAICHLPAVESGLEIEVANPALTEMQVFVHAD